VLDPPRWLGVVGRTGALEAANDAPPAEAQRVASTTQKKERKTSTLHTLLMDKLSSVCTVKSSGGRIEVVWWKWEKGKAGGEIVALHTVNTGGGT
jgi:hypothetical protein